MNPIHDKHQWIGSLLCLQRHKGVSFMGQRWANTLAQLTCALWGNWLCSRYLSPILLDLCLSNLRSSGLIAKLSKAATYILIQRLKVKIGAYRSDKLSFWKRLAVFYDVSIQWGNKFKQLAVHFLLNQLFVIPLQLISVCICIVLPRSFSSFLMFSVRAAKLIFVSI